MPSGPSRSTTRNPTRQESADGELFSSSLKRKPIQNYEGAPAKLSSFSAATAPALNQRTFTPRPVTPRYAKQTSTEKSTASTRTPLVSSLAKSKVGPKSNAPITSKVFKNLGGNSLLSTSSSNNQKNVSAITSSGSTSSTGLDKLKIDNAELLTHSSMMSKRLAGLRNRNQFAERASETHTADSSSSSEEDPSPVELPLSEEKAKQLYLKHPYLLEPRSHSAEPNQSSTLNEYNKRALLKDTVQREDRTRPPTDRGRSEMPQEMAELLQRSARARMDVSSSKSSGNSNYARYSSGAYRADSLDSNSSRVPSYRRSYTASGPLLGSSTSSGWTQPPALTRSSTLDRIITSRGISGSSDTIGTSSMLDTGAMTSGLGAQGGGGMGNGSRSGLCSLTNLSSGSGSSHKPRSDYANRKFALLKSRSSHSIGNLD